MISIKEKFDLSNHNTMGLKASARFFAEIHSISDLREALQYGTKKNLEILILGGGSNILFISDFDGIVILNGIKGIQIISESENEVTLKIGAGENWHQLVLGCVEKGYGGIENLSLIPGTVGAAPIQNIGAYGVELVDVFECLEAYDIEHKELKTFTREECTFGYRDSIFKKQLKGKVVITSVTLRLSKKPELNFRYSSLKERLKEKEITEPTIKDISDTVIEVRQSKLPDPDEIGNTGSFFKNPVISVYQFDELKSAYSELPGYPVSERQVKVPAGWLIEQAGWKGKREGDAGVHGKQALVLVNHGEATGKEIWNLAEKIIESVHQQFDIRLTPEVNILGLTH